MDVAHHLGIERMLGCEDDNWSTRVHEGDGAMLEFRSREALSMDVADFLELEGAFTRQRLQETATDKEEALKMCLAGSQLEVRVLV